MLGESCFFAVAGEEHRARDGSDHLAEGSSHDGTVVNDEYAQLFALHHPDRNVRVRPLPELREKLTFLSANLAGT